MDTRFYAISYNNPERTARMKARFLKVGIPLTFPRAAGPDDPRIPAELDRGSARIWACMWSHLDALRAFVEDETSKYGVICEDDVRIRRDLPRLLPLLIGAYEAYELDVLLLGYLYPFSFARTHVHEGFSPATCVPQLLFLGFEDSAQVWGTQMYMMSKLSARASIELFNEDYARRSLVPGSGCKPFSSDWTLTKRGRRALVYPMMAVEESLDFPQPEHADFHRTCTNANYDPSIHE